ARPLTITAPASARSWARRSATASPYGVGRRAPTTATRGPWGGGQAPRTRISELGRWIPSGIGSGVKVAVYPFGAQGSRCTAAEACFSGGTTHAQIPGSRIPHRGRDQRNAEGGRDGAQGR